METGNEIWRKGEIKMLGSNRSEKLSYIGVITAIVLGFYLSSLYSYLLFHSLIEIFTIAVAFTLFILTWNTRRYLANSYLRLLGIGYAFIALIDLLHTLAYKGMGVFPAYGPNLPTQLWIAARYLQAVTLLAAPLFVERRVNNRTLVGIYAIAVSALVAMVYSGNFPDCYIEGKGLTPFKISSEYVISAILLASLYLFHRKRKYFNDRVFFLIAASIGCTVLSEISFTAYVSVYGFANLVGHFAKLAAFYLIYQAILVTGLKEPFDLIFRDLKQADEALLKSQDTLEEKVRERTAELRASEERYRSLIQKVQAAIVLHDGQGRILTSNPLAQRLLGLSEDQLLGKALIDPEWHFLREDSSVMPIPEYPVSRVLASRQPLRDYVTGISRPDRDEVTWALVNAEPEYNEAGAIERIIVSFIDITERKRAEEALREQYSTLRSIIESANALIFSVDRQYRYTSFNQGHAAVMKALYGAEIEQGHSLLDYMTVPEDRETAKGNLDQALAGEQLVEEAYSGEELRSRRYFQVSHSPVKTEEGEVIGVAVLSQDITERRRAEEQIRRLNRELEQRVLDRTAQLEAANKELEAFAYSVSHDLRAPLRAISGFTAILARRHRANLNDEGRHYLDNVAQAAERMGQLIDDLLAYSRLGRAGVHCAPVALGDIFRPLAEEFAGRVKEIGGTLKIADDLPVVMGDKTLLTQIFTNLLGNALTYRRADVPAHVSVTHQTEAKTVTIRVCDNGIGVPPEHYEKIFNIFQRLHSDEDYPGTGIGLATVKKSVEMLGGRLWVESEVGQGSTFFIKLPKE
jgi:PAS domain S-box-containing protein